MPAYRDLVFVCDLGQATPRVLGLAREIAISGVRTFVISPSLTRAQRNRIGIHSREPWKLLSIPGYKMSYKRDIGVRRYLLAPIRILKRFLSNLDHELVREQNAATKFESKVQDILESQGLIEENSILISSSGPFRYHIVASNISRRSNLTWVADYRDMWSLNHTKLEALNEQQLEFEKFVLSFASGITTVSSDLVSSAQLLYPGKILELQNGHPGMRVSQRKQDWPITITYTGQVYAQYQKLDLFLEALLKFPESQLSGKLEVKFAGDCTRTVREYFRFKKIPVPQYIVLLGSLSREAALELQSQSDYLLALKWDEEKFKNLYSTKIYEYLSSGNPTIVFGSSRDEALGRLVKDAGAGVNLHTSQDVYDFITNQLNSVQYFYNPDVELIQSLSYKELAKKLDSYLISL